MAFDPSMFGSGLGGFLGGLFGNSGAPYDKAMDQYRQWGDKAAGGLQPYQDAGTGAIKNYQDWLAGQKDPSKFINNLMGGYKESPYAQNMQQEAMRSAQNQASAMGLSGSTPLLQYMQQNAGNIASQDQNQWLQNVLGVNQQYGQGQNNLMSGGQNAANSLSNLYNQMGGRMGEQEYNKDASRQNNLWNMLGGIGSMFGGLF
jgi:hypothetical protein